MVERVRQIPVNQDTIDSHQLWNASSQDYLTYIIGESEGDGRMIRDEVLHPLMLKHLGNVSGKKVFDAGCGDGILGREIVKQNANVFGCDFIFDFVSVASSSNPSLLTFVTDVEKLPIANESFDELVSNLVLMWVPDIESTIKEFARVLKSGGKAIVSITHPMINLGTFDLSDEEHPKLILSESLQEGTYLKMINMTNGPYIYFQRPPSTYVNLFTNNGFKLVEGTGYEDVFVSDDFLKKHPEYVLHKMFPIFLILAFEKV